MHAQQDADLARLEAERDAVKARTELEALSLRAHLDQQVSEVPAPTLRFEPSSRDPTPRL